MSLTKLTAIFAFILLNISNLQSQKLWTLAECIEYAEHNNIQLRIQELGIKMQEESVLQSQMSFLPNLSANASGSYNWGKTIDRFTNQFADTRVSSVNLYLQSSMTLFNGFYLLNNVKKQNLELLAQRQEMEAALNMKSLEITTAFLQILYGKENLSVVRQQVSLSEMQVTRTQQLIDAGVLAEGDLFNMKSQLASDISKKVQAENDLELAYLNLKQLMDLPADTLFDIEAPEINIADKTAELLAASTVYNFAVQNQPEIRSAETRYELSLRNLALSRSRYYPTLTISGGVGTGFSGANKVIDGTPVFTGLFPNGDITASGDTVLTPAFDYNTMTKPFSDQMDENLNYSAGLYLSIPIFNNYQTKSQINISKLNVQQAELQLDKAKQDLRKTIEQAYADARAAFNSYQAAFLNVKALEESFNYSSKKYDAGLINSFDLNNARILHENALNNLINAKYSYIFRIKVLDFYFGKPLTF